MSKYLYFKKDVLIEGLKKSIANIYINIEKGCKNPTQLQLYAKFYIAISLRAFFNFTILDKQYTSSKIAKKTYEILYLESFKEALISVNELYNFLNPDIYIKYNEDEKFIILAMINLPSFITSSNINKTKHIIKTYIPKIRSCLKKSQYYIDFFNNKNNSSLSMKSALFKFLVENG